jgi:hypothetical protein
VCRSFHLTQILKQQQKPCTNTTITTAATNTTTATATTITCFIVSQVVKGATVVFSNHSFGICWETEANREVPHIILMQCQITR